MSNRSGPLAATSSIDAAASRNPIRSATSAALSRSCVTISTAVPRSRTSETSAVEFGRRARIQAGRRLVEQQHRHLAQQRDGDRHLLPHALGKAAEPLVPGPLLQPRGGEGRA